MRDVMHVIRIPRVCSVVVAVSIMLACVILTQYADEDLARGLSLSGVSFPFHLGLEDILDAIPAPRAYVDRVEGGLRLHANTTMHFEFETSAERDVLLTLVARGTPVNEVYPYVTIDADGEFVKGIFVTSLDWGVYRATIPMARGRHDLAISFVNDQFKFPAARDLDVRSIVIGEPLSHADAYIRYEAPCLLVPDMMANQTFGIRTDDGYRLWDGGVLEDDVYFAEEQRIPIHVRIAKPPGSLEPGIVHMYVNDVFSGEFVATSTSRVTRSVRVEMKKGFNRLRLENRTSSTATGLDSDIIVEGLFVGADVPRSFGRAPPLLLASNTAAINGVDFMFKSNGQSASNAWCLWSTGYITTPVRCQEAGRWRMQLTWRGDACEGLGPRVMVQLDEDQVFLGSVQESAFNRVVLPVELSSGDHDLTIAFMNDFVKPGVCDRNLYIRDAVFSKVP